MFSAGNSILGLFKTALLEGHSSVKKQFTILLIVASLTKIYTYETFPSTLLIFKNEYLDPILRANMFTLFKRIRSEKGNLLPNLKSENFMGSQAQDMIILGAWLTVFLWVV